MPCSGPIAAQAELMYLISSLGVTEMLPMATISLAGLALALGLAGMVTLRSERG